MHAQPRRAACDHDGVRAHRFQCGAKTFPIQSFAQQQAFGAPATRRIDVVVMTERIGGIVRGRWRAAAHAHGAGPALDELGDAFEQVDESLRARVHHARLLQQRHLPWGVGQRAARTVQRTCEAAARIGRSIDLARGGLQFVGERRDDAEDGAFHWLRQGLTGALRALADGCGERAAVQFRQGPHALGHPIQELRQDRAGVAARTVDGIVADAAEQVTGVLAGLAERPVQHAAQGRCKVVAGVAVGHGEHVDAVQSVARGDDPPGAGDQRQAQGGCGQGAVLGFGHARSLPQAVGLSCCVAAADAGFSSIRRRRPAFRRTARADGCRRMPFRL